MKRGYFCICYRVHFTIYFKDTIINQQRIGEVFFFFFFFFFFLGGGWGGGGGGGVGVHLIYKSIKVSDNKFTLFVIDVLELTFLHLYVQSVNSHLYDIDKVSLKSNISNTKKCIKHLFEAYNALVHS